MSRLFLTALALIPAMSITVITSEAELTNACQNASTAVLLKLFAPWCPACQNAQEPYEELAGEYGPRAGIVFAELNVSEHDTSFLPKSAQPRSIPTFLLLNPEQSVVKTQVGFRKEALVSMLKSFL